MSGISSKPNFVEEFAYRTKINYYYGLLRIADQEQKELINEKIERIKNEMKEKQYAYNDSFFEITQLINSLIGLLILPQQENYNRIRNFRNLNGFPTLKKYFEQTDEDIYINTYKESVREINWDDNPNETKLSDFLRHLRNAISHRRVMIHPENCNVTGDKITHVIFEDECFRILDTSKDRPKWKPIQEDEAGCQKEYYKLKVKAEDFEPFLMDIADFIIRNSN